MKDMIVVGLLIVAFAMLFTVHVTIVFGLARRPPRWRAPVAFFVPVLAPFWAFQERMRVRAAIWVGAIVLYLVALLLSM